MSKAGMSNSRPCFRVCAALATLSLPHNVFQTVIKCLFKLTKELVQSTVANKPGLSNIRPTRRFYPTRGPNVSRHVIFCGQCKNFVPQCKCLAWNLVCQKLRFFKLKLRENRHEVMDDYC